VDIHDPFLCPDIKPSPLTNIHQSFVGRKIRDWVRMVAGSVISIYSGAMICCKLGAWCVLGTHFMDALDAHIFHRVARLMSAVVAQTQTLRGHLCTVGRERAILHLGRVVVALFRLRKLGRRQRVSVCPDEGGTGAV